MAIMAVALPSAAQITFYEHADYRGRAFTPNAQVRDFTNYGFNDRASSVVVARSRWEVCDDIMYRGRCVVLRPGRYPSLASMGLNDRVSSMRMIRRNARVEEDRYAPTYEDRPFQNFGYNRRDGERLYEAEVVEVRAIGGTTERRCWMERERVASSSRDANVPGAILGAVLGGVLGHQIGGGRGKDFATAGGAIVGATVGATSNRQNESYSYGQNVERCSDDRTFEDPSFWDITYRFRGEDHRMQTSVAPGETVLVNEFGEPRN